MRFTSHDGGQRLVLAATTEADAQEFARYPDAITLTRQPDGTFEYRRAESKKPKGKARDAEPEIVTNAE